MNYKVSYVHSNLGSFDYETSEPEVYELLRHVEKCDIKSFTISLAESAQKGGIYVQQPE